MKVNIKKPNCLLSAYDVSRALLFWKEFDDDAVYDLADSKIINAFVDFYNLMVDYFDFSGSPNRITIEDHDTWNADYTLALIILPTLRKVKEYKHGSPYVDYEDAPSELVPDPLPEVPWYENGDTDEFWHDRWDWVIDEMIFPFEQMLENDYWDTELYKDEEYAKRFNNGLRLFGKYYTSLWT